VTESLAGKLLVAGPKLVDPNFQRTVVLICSHDEKGAFGLVLNRPLEGATVGEHVPAWVEHVAEPAVVFQGGPVEATVGLGLALGREPDDAPGWTPVVGRVGLVDLGRPPGSEGSADIERARVFAGYSGWGAGQLEAEMADEAWFVVDVHPGDAFTPDPGRLWHDVLWRQGGKLAMFAFFPQDPTVN
jgi:putative transcriptional regulator